MAFILLSLLPICIVDIYGYLILDWGGQLYVTMLETFILSCLMICMILYEAKYGPMLPENFFEHTDSYDITQQGLPDGEKPEPTSQNLLTTLFSRFPKQEPPVDKKGQRINSEPDIEIKEEEDQRKLKSFPCSPRTQEKAYNFFNEDPQDQELADNVISVPVDVDPNEAKEPKEKTDSLNQTIPMAKLQELKKKLQVIPEEPKRLFDLDSSEENPANPLEISERSSKVVSSDAPPPDTKGKEGTSNKDSQDTLLQTSDKPINEYKRKGGALDLRAAISKDFTSQNIGCKTFFDGKQVPEIFDSSEGFKFSMVKLDQSRNVETLHDKSKEDTSLLEGRGFTFDGAEVQERSKKPLKLPVKDKTISTEKPKSLNNEEESSFAQEEEKEPKAASTIFISDIIVPIEESVKPEDKLFERNPNCPLNIENIFGEFDVDETNAILISETLDGKLIDKKGRKVNKYGYLIDNDGNIIDVNGEIVFRKEDFEREINRLNSNPEDLVDRRAGKESGEDLFAEEMPSKYGATHALASTMWRDPKRDIRNLELERIYSPRYVRMDMQRYKNALNRNRNSSRRRPKNAHREMLPFAAFEQQEEMKEGSQSPMPLFVSEYKRVRIPRRRRERNAVLAKQVNSEAAEAESNYEAIKRRVNETKFPKVDAENFLDSL
eukprot:TRINITY_DN456_c0_g3_i2.p1 TRINITY_DN456_c0_g3~~TRINITY_DN456_c0_g3_i2.p1  ORF type:complete len:662 (-),score=210.64 TRINITY_DN456_c0_g3_i2:65-2050(-)